MNCVEDFNRLSRMLFSGRVRRGRVGNLSVAISRDDVVPVMLELRDMLNIMYTRLHP